LFCAVLLVQASARARSRGVGSRSRLPAARNSRYKNSGCTVLLTLLINCNKINNLIGVRSLLVIASCVLFTVQLSENNVKSKHTVFVCEKYGCIKLFGPCFKSVQL
jgi:hypothetical protein